MTRVDEGVRTLDAKLRALSDIADGGARIRIHGDYHLGQVLWSEGDFYILDFEGEPAKPLEERRAKESALRDVAGMLRSFGYAAAVASQSAVRTNPGAEPLIDAWAAVWETWISAVFLQSYVATASGRGIIPDNSAELASLLDLFMLDKAFYELRYELNNRPEWVHAPLGAVARLV